MNTVTPAEIRTALQDLALRAAGFVHGRGKAAERAALLAAIAAANAILAAGDAPPALPDAETMVRAYIDGGHPWPELVAAVSRNSLEGATRRRA